LIKKTANKAFIDNLVMTLSMIINNSIYR